MPPIAVDLEADRRRHRERRLRSVLAVLDARAERFSGAGHPVPPSLAAMIDGFRHELAATQAQAALRPRAAGERPHGLRDR